MPPALVVKKDALVTLPAEGAELGEFGGDGEDGEDVSTEPVIGELELERGEAEVEGEDVPEGSPPEVVGPTKVVPDPWFEDNSIVGSEELLLGTLFPLVVAVMIRQLHPELTREGLAPQPSIHTGIGRDEVRV